MLQADKSAFKAKKVGIPTADGFAATSPKEGGGKKGSRAKQSFRWGAEDEEGDGCGSD